MVILLWAYNAQYSSVEGLDLKPLTTFSDVANQKQVIVGPGWSKLVENTKILRVVENLRVLRLLISL